MPGPDSPADRIWAVVGEDLDRRIALSRKVFLHVGVAKTGTTFLQRVMFAHRDALRASGLLYPGSGSGAHFIAALDLRGKDDAKFDHLSPEGRWDSLASEIRRFDGNAVISHETLARCSRGQVD